MQTSVHARLAAAALATLALTAGCGVLGGGSSPSTAPAPSDPPASSAGAPASPTEAQPSPADPSASAGTDQLGQPFATREGGFDGQKVRVRLYPVLREGTVSHVNLVLSSPATGSDHVQVAEMLSDHNADAGDKDPFAADGLTLVDGKNAKLYLVASDGAGTCLCSKGFSSVFLEDDAPLLVSATFAAPPADVTTVDVRIPTFGTVKGVPLQ
ncbi:hypothetical protein [Microlunatus flavus]|uniref:Uncharacterized protein n=1 Tax=Microlunatus flavus TaxID=1036181 RepID=A0A1H9AZS4_9ACTN|nr:hypothetical protein [Microlunatus flavus]SEP82256.1 hypothetical protein SAMN05421756_101791 [Microlunatus flavus]